MLVEKIKERQMWRSRTSTPTFIHMNNPMSSTAQTENESHSVWPQGKISITGNTLSSCHQSKSPTVFFHCRIKHTLTVACGNWSCDWEPKVEAPVHFVLDSLSRRFYDTALEYFINVSTTCDPVSQPVGVHLEVGVFASLCQYFSESEKQWRTDGMVPLAETNASRAVCRTRHLTAFAAGLFVPPDAISFIVPVSIPKNTPMHKHQIDTHWNCFLSPSGAVWCAKPGCLVGVCVGLTELCCGCSHLAQAGPAGSTSGWCGSTLWPRRAL